MLCGPCGAGKSTEAELWLTHFFCFAYPRINFYYGNSDELIERYARFTKQKYSDCFKKVIQRACKRVYRLAKKAREERACFIWDQTSLTRKIRDQRLREFKRLDYHCVLCYPIVDDWWQLFERVAKRDRGPSGDIVANMIRDYEMPTLDEQSQYDEVFSWHV